MGYFNRRRAIAPEPPPTSPHDPVEELFNSLQETLLESEQRDLLDGISLEKFRALYGPLERVAYRQAALKLVGVVAFSLDWLRTPQNEVRYWQAAFAVGAPDCIGLTMTTKATQLGLKSRACLSQGAVKFCQGAGLPPSGYMKGKGTGKAYSDARNAFLDGKEEE